MSDYDKLCKRLQKLGRYGDDSAWSCAFIAIESLQARVKWIDISKGLKCPACDNVGWYVGLDGEQEQCEFCYTCPDSIFNKSNGVER